MGSLRMKPQMALHSCLKPDEIWVASSVPVATGGLHSFSLLLMWVKRRFVCREPRFQAGSRGSVRPSLCPAFLPDFVLHLIGLICILERVLFWRTRVFYLLRLSTVCYAQDVVEPRKHSVEYSGLETVPTLIHPFNAADWMPVGICRHGRDERTFEGSKPGNALIV